MIYLIGLILFLTNSTTGPELVDRSIKFHDPDGLWSTLQTQINFEETRPSGGVRKTNIYIDNLNGHFCMSREIEGHNITRHIVNNECSYEVDDNSNYSESEADQYKLVDDRSYTMRDYYLYLWGMPMKLKDPGTIIHETVEEAKFNGEQTFKVKVTYEAETGSDTWYFYFRPENAQLVGYQFFHDESINDGEYITLGDSEPLSGMIIPNQRAWYFNKDNKHLGTDSFVQSGPSDHIH